jgi:hypothetical protein
MRRASTRRQAIASKGRLIPLLAVTALVTGVLAPEAQAEPNAYVQVCKDAAPGVTGNFTFNIDEVVPTTPFATATRTVTVPVGGCSKLPGVGVASRYDIRITELPDPNTTLFAITPPSVSASLPNRTAVVYAPPGTTTVHFVNHKGSVLTPSHGQLKVCKVAGPGVAVGRVFNFTADQEGPFSVAAGAAPGGICKLGPSFKIGSVVRVGESGVKGLVVSDIRTSPLARLVRTPDLGSGIVDVAIGPGITTVTFTNRARGSRWGWIEPCVYPLRRRPGLVRSLTLRGKSGTIGTFAVPAGGCAAAVPVQAGDVTVKMARRARTGLVACATVPRRRQRRCDLDAGTSKVSVRAGDAAAETVAILKAGARP